MPDFQYDKQPPLDYKYHDKPKNTDSYEPERGGCLTAFLVVMGIGNIALIGLSLVSLGDVSSLPVSVRGTVQFLFYLQIVVSIAACACAYGLWNWKSWAYNGLYALYLINALISLFAGQIPSGIGGFVGMGILYYLMKDKSSYLE